MTFAREAWPFALPPALAALLLAALRLWLPAVVFAAVAVLLLGFFRVPRRPLGADVDTLLSAADGKVTAVDRVTVPELGEGRFQRVVTFLSVFNVHLQRAPTSGSVTFSHYRAGPKLAAFRAAAADNESHLTALRRDDGEVVGIRQIAGLLARRVGCYLRPDERVEAGQPLGLIKFGSRVDLLIPDSFEVLVRPGQRVREGLTPMARRRWDS
jgi:phosphatidylserine decarboxylase